ncbi:hypothetical protein MSM1_17565 [Mycobacterium sp. SM1]|nr:hypothetical protein [Mycobacterium sp. SM1]
MVALNNSEGIGDAAGAPDIIVNTGQMASLNPLTGVRLRPGELFNMPLLDPATGYQLALSAVATGPGAVLQLLLRE